MVEDFIEKLFDEDYNKYICIQCKEINTLCVYPYCFTFKNVHGLTTKYRDTIEELEKNKTDPKVEKAKDKLTHYFRGNIPKSVNIIDEDKDNTKEIGEEESKSKAEVNEENIKNGGVVEVNLAIVNPGGCRGKAKSISNLCINNNIKILVCSETHTSGSEVPRVSPDMVPFHRNRSETKTCKGGVCVYVHDSIKDHAVVVERGDDQNNDEWIAVRLNCFTPHLVIIGVYGQQENIEREAVREKWRRIFGAGNRFKDDGADVIIAGDWNVSLGCELGLVENDSSVSSAGKEVIDLMTKNNWFLANSLIKGNQRTHVDRSGGRERALDFIATSSKEIVMKTVCDNSFEATPYKVLMKGKTLIGRRFTDHKTVMMKMKLQRKPAKNVDPPEPRFIKSEESIAYYKVYTDDIARKLLPEVIQKKTPTVKVLKKIRRLMKKAKYKAHKVRRPSKKRAKVLSDEEIFFYQTNNLEEEMRNLENMKVNDKIWKTRQENITKERGRETNAIFDENGVLQEEKEDIVDAILRYNANLLGRNEHPRSFKELAELKKKLMDTLTEAEIWKFDTITEEEYVRAVKKITRKHKNMFLDFIESGPEFKVLIFYLLRRIYEEEDIPDDFFITVLQPLHKKGDRRVMGNYRFLHLRDFLSRLLELLIYQKLEPVFDDFTGESQTGGMKESDTLEHLLTLMSMVKKCENCGEACIFTFLDIKKCFDCAHLSDMNFELFLNDLDLKALKMFQIISGKNVIRIQGGEKTVLINNGEGQGSVGAARSCSLGITSVVERVSKTHPDPVFLNNVNIATSSFVDDTMSTDKSAPGAKVSGSIMTVALDELALEAHEKKTIQICCGEEKAVAKIKEDLKENPTEVQGWKVSQGRSEKYLGVVICEGGTKEIIDANIKEKKMKVMPVLKKIKILLKDPKILRIGRMKAACLLLQSQILPILLYGVECWLGITEEQYKKMEDILRTAICMLLSLPKNTPYEALLNEAGQFPMRQWIHVAKIRYINRKIHFKQKGRLYQILRHDIIHGVKTGFIGEAEELCKLYNLPNVTTCPLRPEAISRACKEVARKKIWSEVMKKRKIPMLPNSQKMKLEHHEFDPMRSKLISSYNCGAIVTKKTNPQCIPRKFMENKFDRHCLWPGCDGLDEISHIRNECQFYKTKMKNNKEWSDVRNLAEFLFELEAERQKEFGFSLLISGSWF